jgi:hypothetical protein
MRPQTLLIACLTILALIGQSESAEWPTKIEKTVSPGGTVEILRINYYNPDRGCIPLPVGSFDGYPKPKLGSLLASAKAIRQDGPCGKLDYNVQSIAYKAGLESGIDEFVLYLFTGGPDRINIKVSVVGGARQASIPRQTRSNNNDAKKISPQKPSRNSNPAQKTQPRTDEIAGSYVNNLGNIVNIEGEFLYFSGTWSGEKVKRKPFAIENKSASQLVWAMYDCTGNGSGFSCIHRVNGERRIFKKLPQQ